jgi:Trp operon repressor
MALIEEEVTERSDPFVRSEDEEEREPAGGVVPRKRGRPAIPIQWTRVMLIVPGQEV